MSQQFPAFQLLITLSVALIVGLPLLVWLFMHGNRDTGARLWFSAVACNSLALILVGIWQRFSALSAVLFLLAVLLGIASMRWELGQRTPWRWWGLGFGVYALLQFALESAGLRMSVGYTLNLFILVAAEVLLIWLLIRVSQLNKSRGLLMVAVGIALIVVPNVYRLGMAIMEGGGPQVFDGVPATNVAIVIVTLVSMLHVVGYGGFVMEKLHQRRLDLLVAEERAKERQALAERHAQEVEGIVRQRDEMILLNSRFSVVNNLAVYSSAIVHEISQPLQALLSILDGMSIRNPAATPRDRQSIEHANAMVRKMAGTLDTLRGLLGGQKPQVESVDVNSMLEEILPIIQTQADRQRVRLLYQRVGGGPHFVKANRLLLQRVVFNLATNSLEAFQTQKLPSSPSPSLSIRTRLQQERGVDHIVFQVTDDGPGLPENLELKAGLLMQSNKAHGMGLGMGFVQMLIESWNGRLTARNREPDEGGGAEVEVWLPKTTET